MKKRRNLTKSPFSRFSVTVFKTDTHQSSEWQESNLRDLGPKPIRGLGFCWFLTVFSRFYSGKEPLFVLFDTLVCAVSVRSKAIYGQFCGQKYLTWTRAGCTVAGGGLYYSIVPQILQEGWGLFSGYPIVQIYQLIWKSRRSDCGAVSKEKWFGRN